MKFSTIATATAIAAALSFEAYAAPSMDAINKADPTAEQSQAAIIRLETLLDRAGASVGAIDGVMDGPTEAAIAAYREMNGMDAAGGLTGDVWSSLSKDSEPAVTSYTITEDDVAFELTPPTPETYAEMAKLDKLGFHSYSEAMAEKFQMGEELLKELNPDADFAKAGTEILVVEPGNGMDTQITRIEIDTKSGRLNAYADDKLVFAAPATVGSEQNPSPEGTMKVTAIAPDPNYTFEPKNLGEDSSKEAVIVPPGANGPVGTMWIDLGKPTYGIHGTPYPSKIASMESHGCVRLTNWDATALAQIVQPGSTEVTFTK